MEISSLLLFLCQNAGESNQPAKKYRGKKNRQFTRNPFSSSPAHHLLVEVGVNRTEEWTHRKPHCLPSPLLFSPPSTSLGRVVVVWQTEVLVPPFTELLHHSLVQTTSHLTHKHTRQRIFTHALHGQREQRGRMLSSLQFPNHATPPAYRWYIYASSFCISCVFTNLCNPILNTHSCIFSFSTGLSSHRLATGDWVHGAGGQVRDVHQISGRL